MTKTIELIYSQQATDYIEGRAYSNPRFFTTPRSGVGKVFVVGDWPDIVAAYEALGVPVERMDAATAVGAPPAPPVPEPPIVPRLDTEARAAVEIPADWQGLPWPKLRKLGASFSDAPVLNKADAGAAIEGELARRAGAGVHGLPTINPPAAELPPVGGEYAPGVSDA